MSSSTSAPPWYRNRFLWVAVILLTVAATAVLLVRSAGSGAGGPTDLTGTLERRLQVILEEADPAAHQGHGDHVHQGAGEAPVVCGVRVYGFEPTTATGVEQVERVYGYHLCGIAEAKRPWDWAVKLVGPVIVELSATPPTIVVAESTAEYTFTERVRQLFPERYQEEALREALGTEAITELRRRYETAAGL
jgi:hypothetical protein